MVNAYNPNFGIDWNMSDDPPKTPDDKRTIKLDWKEVASELAAQLAGMSVRARVAEQECASLTLAKQRMERELLALRGKDVEHTFGGVETATDLRAEQSTRKVLSRQHDRYELAGTLVGVPDTPITVEELVAEMDEDEQSAEVQSVDLREKYNNAKPHPDHGIEQTRQIMREQFLPKRDYRCGRCEATHRLAPIASELMECPTCGAINTLRTA